LGTNFFDFAAEKSVLFRKSESVLNFFEQSKKYGCVAKHIPLCYNINVQNFCIVMYRCFLTPALLQKKYREEKNEKNGLVQKESALFFHCCGSSFCTHCYWSFSA
jgi:hypothetical protein